MICKYKNTEIICVLIFVQEAYKNERLCDHSKQHG